MLPWFPHSMFRKKDTGYGGTRNHLMGHVLVLILNILRFTSTFRVHQSTFSIYAVKINVFVVH